MKTLNNILEYARQHRSTPLALATLVRTHGSTYRKPGARMLVTPEGKTIGVLSGGCLEELIAQDAMEVLNDAQGRLRVIDTRQYFGCDGRLEIWVERIEAAGQDGNLLTLLADELDRRVSPCLTTKFSGENTGSRLTPSFSLLTDSDEVFIQRIPLPIRLLVFGRGPEIGPLSALAETLGWVLNIFEHPSECGENIHGDSLTAALVMNHHFGKDAEALSKIVPLKLPYIGILGPRRRTNQLLSHLMDLNATDLLSLESLHAPAGLDIGSETPEEIALSIVSEVLAVLSGRQSGFLSCHQDPVPMMPHLTRKEA